MTRDLLSRDYAEYVSERKSDGRSLVVGSSWLLLSQLLVMAIQVVYTALVSRLVPSAGFGAFAVAVSASALVGLISGAGLANASARTSRTDESSTRSLTTSALISGAVGAVFLVAIATPWSELWGTPAAIEVLHVLALGSVVAPASGVAIGILRRRGAFAAAARISFMSSIVAMALGGGAVFLTRTPAALAVMGATLPLLQWLFALWVLRRALLPGPLRSSTRHDYVFGLKAMGASLMAYLHGMLPQLALSKSSGDVILGNWNRSTALISVPLEAAWTAAVAALYPQFRDHASRAEQVRVKWTDLLSVIAIVVWPVCLFAVPLVPAYFGVVLGPQWATAVLMGQILLPTMAVGFSTVVLGSALESAALFRVTYLVNLLGVAAVAVGFLVTVAVGDWIIAPITLLISYVLMHLVQVITAVRLSLVSGKRLLVRYLAASASAGFAWLAGVLIARSQLPFVAQLLLAFFVLSIVVVGVALRRRSIPVIRDFARYLESK